MPRLSAFELPEELGRSLSHVKTVESLLVRDRAQIARDAELETKAVEKVVRELAVSTASVQLNRPVRSIHDLPDARQLLASCHDCSIATGVAGVDALLLGGLQLGTITELVGLSGAGKTQLCLASAVSAACEGHSVVYFDCNGSASPARLVEMAMARLGQERQRECAEAMDRIAVERCFDYWGLFDGLTRLHEEWQSQPAAVHKLVVIDSVQALLQPLFAGRQLWSGQGLISQLVNLLRQLASLWQTAILVTNGIVLPAYSSGVTPMGIRAALGSVWDRAPDVRLLLRREDSASHVAAAVATALVTRSRTVDVQVLRHSRMEAGNFGHFAITTSGLE